VIIIIMSIISDSDLSYDDIPSLIKYLRGVGDFPLERLALYYFIQFDELETLTINLYHKIFWLQFYDMREKLPPSFVGTPLELWGMLETTLFHVKMLNPKTNKRKPPFMELAPGLRKSEKMMEIADAGLILVPPPLQEDYFNGASYYGNLATSLRRIRSKICRPTPPELNHNRIVKLLSSDYPADQFEELVRLLGAWLDHYLEFTAPSNFEFTKIEDSEKYVALINYASLVCGRVINPLDYGADFSLPNMEMRMIPASIETTSMEMWLVNEEARYEVARVPGKRQIPFFVHRYLYLKGKIKDREFYDEAFTELSRQTLIDKISLKGQEKSYENFKGRERVRAFMMGTSKKHGNESLIGRLPNDVARRISEVTTQWHRIGDPAL
jgi:hypothetical protein